MRAIWTFVMATVATGCMTDPAGNSCAWAPGNDGYCPPDGGGGGTPPSFHTFSDPQFIKVGTEPRLLVNSGGEDYQAREELALTAAPGALPQRVSAGFADGYTSAIACGTVCIAAWRDDSGHVRSSVRAGGEWSTPIAYEGAIRSPAVATHGDAVFVAWSTWEFDIGARVELRRLDLAGNVIGSSTLATGVSHGHLSLSAGPRGALVTWEAVEPSTLEPDGTWATHARLIAQPIALHGSPVGAPLEYPLAQGDGDYYRPAPAAFVDGAFRVTHGYLEDGATWLVIDPEARTIAPATIGTLEWPRTIESIVPVVGGAVLGLSGRDGSVVRVADDMIVDEVTTHAGWSAPAIIALPSGFRIAFAEEGSLYVEDLSEDLTPIGDATLLAARYEVGGCSTGGGLGFGGIALVLGFVVRRRR